MRRFATIVSLVSSVLGGVASAQEAAVTFKSSVALVPISAVVRDQRGRTVTTLRAADFEVRDNGEKRQILSFQADEAAPLTVAVLVDMSGSMRLESKTAAAREVIDAIAADLRSGVDVAGVFTFDTALREACAFTDRPSLLGTALANEVPFGATSLYDAIAQTALRFENRPTGRRAIVVLTDGIDTSSALAAPEVSSRASAIDVPVYIVATVPKIDQASYVDRLQTATARSQADARDLAVWTGGDLLWAHSTLDAARAAWQIMRELRHQYLIAVDSASDGDWRAVDVRVRDRRMTVRARSGYFVRDTRSSSR